jgi:hypothetical protein
LQYRFALDNIESKKEVISLVYERRSLEPAGNKQGFFFYLKIKIMAEEQKEVYIVY